MTPVNGSTLPVVFSSPIDPVAALPLVNATFTAANSTLISAYTPERAPVGSAWATNSGTEWQIQSNAVRGSGESGTQSEIDSGEANVDVECDIILTGALEAGLQWRWSSISAYFLGFLQNSNDTVHIYIQNVGFTDLGSAALTLGAATYTTRGTVDSNNQHTVYVGGTQYVQVTNTTFSTNTQVGIYESNGVLNYDDFDCYTFGDRP